MSKSDPSKNPVVRQFMSTVLVSLESRMTLEDAAQFFAARKITTIPVLGKSGEIVGVLSDFQLLRELLKMRQENKHGVTLGDVSQDLDPVVTVSEDESIASAFRLMIESHSHRIYAVKDNRLTGALSPKDLLLYMAGIKDKSQDVLDSVVQRQIESILKELHDARRQLSDFQQMFYDSPFLMHSVDLQGKIINANRMIHFVLGYEDGELIGKTLRQLYPPETYRQAMEGLETVRTLGFHPLINTVMMKKNGEVARIDIASTVKKDESGRAEGTITVGRLSDSHRMLNYLQKAAAVYSSKTQKRSS